MEKLINGRTPEEIRTAVINCDEHCSCIDCPEDERDYCDQSVVIKYARCLIERLESERDAALAKVPKWISVKYRLPEKDDNVLISLCGCNVKQAVYRGDGVFEAAYADTYHSTDLGSIVLTHWMPTPKPMEVSE